MRSRKNRSLTKYCVTQINGANVSLFNEKKVLFIMDQVI